MAAQSSVTTISPTEAPSLVGELKVKIISCSDLTKGRLIGKMDPYVKVDCAGDEKFKTHKSENGDHNPQWGQTFLFNLKGKETDLHLKVYDSETFSDTYIGRADISLWQLLSSGGGEQKWALQDPDEFKKNTGYISVQVAFAGTGGPVAAEEKAPIAGHFHFQHNASGFIAHVVGDRLQLRAGGANLDTNAFEFQGPYIRYVVNSTYLHGADADGSLVLKAGIGEEAKFKWTGIGLVHVASGKLLHPHDDAMAVNTPLELVSGATAASGFTLLACTPAPVAAMANLAVSQPTGSGQEGHAHGGFDLDDKSTWPEVAHVTCHAHPLKKLPTIYQGTYNCDHCGLQGQGTVYHDDKHNYDMHPACVHQKLKHHREE